jgi:hypothetical protein
MLKNNTNTSTKNQHQNQNLIRRGNVTILFGTLPMSIGKEELYDIIYRFS